MGVPGGPARHPLNELVGDFALKLGGLPPLRPQGAGQLLPHEAARIAPRVLTDGIVVAQRGSERFPIDPAVLVAKCLYNVAQVRLVQVDAVLSEQPALEGLPLHHLVGRHWVWESVGLVGRFAVGCPLRALRADWWFLLFGRGSRSFFCFRSWVGGWSEATEIKSSNHRNFL